MNHYVSNLHLHDMMQITNEAELLQKPPNMAFKLMALSHGRSKGLSRVAETANTVKVSSI
jgi:hypothetical protein